MMYVLEVAAPGLHPCWDKGYVQAGDWFCGGLFTTVKVVMAVRFGMPGG